MTRKSNVILLFFATLIMSHVTVFSCHYWFWWAMLTVTAGFGWLTCHELEMWSRENDKKSA